MSIYRALAATLAAGCLAALPTAAVAVPRGDDAPKGPARIEICKYGLDTFDVYAAGESIRWDSLGYGKEVCTDWKPVAPGMYDISFAQHVASQSTVRVLARLYVGDKRPQSKRYKGEGVMNALVRKGETVRLELYAKRSCCH